MVTSAGNLLTTAPTATSSLFLGLATYVFFCLAAGGRGVFKFEADTALPRVDSFLARGVDGSFREARRGLTFVCEPSDVLETVDNVGDVARVIVGGVVAGTLERLGAVGASAP